MMMPNRLKALDVQWISLVKTPANALPLLLKDANVKPFCVLKTDDERRMVYGIVYAPDRVDSQGDFADRFEIERAAHWFIKAHRSAQVDKNHAFEALPGAYVAESWITRGDDGLFAEMVPHAWAVGIKVEDEALWNAVKAGEYAGLSLAGHAEREPVDSAPDAAIPPSAAVEKAEGDAPPPRPAVEKAEGDVGGIWQTLQARLEDLVQTQTQLADRLTTVEKQRLSVDHSPPAAPINWLREVL
jgi:hypothetical protein